MLYVGRPKNYWYRECEAQPELVTKHSDGMSGVTVVTRVGVGNLVPSVLVNRFAVLVCHVVHFQLRCQMLRPMGHKQISWPN